jgi:predicted metalloprotease
MASAATEVVEGIVVVSGGGSVVVVVLVVVVLVVVVVVVGVTVDVVVVSGGATSSADPQALMVRSRNPKVKADTRGIMSPMNARARTVPGFAQT